MPPLRIFRPAPARSTRANVAWTLVQSAAIWTVALVAGPAALLAIESALGIPKIDFLWHPAAGATLFLTASFMNLMTGIALSRHGRGTPLPTACPRELVVAGPYRYVRNPMAIAGVAQGVAVALWFGSAAILLYAIAGAVIWHVMVRPAEERDLELRFGRDYGDYRAAVPLWWPRWQPFIAGDLAEARRRVDNG